MKCIAGIMGTPKKLHLFKDVRAEVQSVSLHTRLALFIKSKELKVPKKMFK